MVIITKILGYFLKNIVMNAIFLLTVFEILLLNCRMVLGPAQWGLASERVKFVRKKPKNVGLAWKVIAFQAKKISNGF